MWTDHRTTQESLHILGTLAALCVTGPISHHLFQMVERKDYKSLIDYKFNYNDDDGNVKERVQDFKDARQIQALYSKLDFLELGYDREEEAWRSFLNAEERCLWTNRKIEYLRRKPEKGSPTLASVIHLAQRKISKVLGPFSMFREFTCSFGPGANTTVCGHSSSPRLKLGAQIACSNELLPYASEHLSDAPQWVAVHSITDSPDSWVINVNVTPGKLVFVPKNAKTHRSIIVEPLLNSYLQKGVGSFLKDRLMAFGVDLHDQTLNQSLARYGSLEGHVSTLDLSSASDSLARELVYELLPLDWAEYLDSLCTRDVTYKGVLLPRLEKFSSMGNGFTFELESLIFWALTKAVCDLKKVDSTPVNVYGDDIIVPVSADSDLRAILSQVGFVVNDQKSFSSGPFRESCGADYYKGIDIRPLYCKTLISDRTLYSMHNWFIRHQRFCLADQCRHFIKGDELHGPDGYGDGHLIGSWYYSDLKRSRSARRQGWSGGTFETYTLKPRFNKKPGKGDPAYPTYSVYTRAGELNPSDPNVVRGSRGVAKVSIYVLPKD